MTDFKRLSSKQLDNLDEIDKIKYQKSLIEYYGNLKKQLKNYNKLDYIHSILLFFLKFYPVDITLLNNLTLPSDDGSVIFSANHSNAFDFPVISKSVGKHFFIMADYTMQNDMFINLLNKLNGCVYIDRKSKKSSQNAFEQSVEGVNKGYNMLLFCESTWNLLDKQPMLPRKWGDIKIAQATGRPIIPIAIAYNDNKSYVKFGNVRYVTLDDDIKRIDKLLFEEMSELRNDIWNSEDYRANNLEMDYDEWLKQTLNTYKNFDVEYEMSMIRDENGLLSDQIKHIIDVGEEIRPVAEIEKKLLKSKINYRF